MLSDVEILKKDLINYKIGDSLNFLTTLCYTSSAKAGWHDKPREVGTALMLMVSELAEAMEGDRKDLMDSHLPHRKSLEVELADCMIRIFDFCGSMNLDIGGALVEKFLYNQTRADHKREVRALKNGKRY